MKIISKKLLLLGLSCALLIGVTVYMTTAWYTRMVSNAGMEFEVAQWEFTANKMISDFTVNIYQYSHVLQDSSGNTMVAAPGTAGYIPVVLSLGDSEVDLDYYVTVDVTTMSPEFQERIFFYFENEDGELQKFLGEGEDLTGSLLLDELEEVTIYIYWEWVYEVIPTMDADGVAYDLDTAEGKAAQQAATDANNEFDTLVGKNPDSYATDMIATLQIYGVQKEPVSTDAANVFESMNS